MLHALTADGSAAAVAFASALSVSPPGPLGLQTPLSSPSPIPLSFRSGGPLALLGVDPLVLPLAVLLGAAVTLLGGGGGVWYLLVLLWMGLDYRIAVPTSLAAVVLTTAFGSVGHLGEGRVDLRVAAPVVAGSVVGTGVGARVVSTLPTATLETAFGVFLLATAGFLWYRGDDETRAWTVPPRVRLPAAVCVGVVTGVASAVFGISGTPVLLPGLAVLGLSSTRVVGTSVVAILGTAVAGVGWYATLSGLAWDVAVPFGLAAGVGALLAPRLYAYVPDEGLDAVYRVVFSAVCAVSGVAFLL